MATNLVRTVAGQSYTQHSNSNIKDVQLIQRRPVLNADHFRLCIVPDGLSIDQSVG